MKMNNIKKISLALALVMIIACLLSIGALADNKPTTVVTSWTQSEDKSQLKNNTDGRVYDLYYTDIPIYDVPSIVYVFYRNIYTSDYYWSELCQNPDYKEAVWAFGNYQNDIFVTAQGKKDLDAFLAGDIGSFWLIDQSPQCRAALSKENVAALDKALHDGVNTQSFEVKDIIPSNKRFVYEIHAMDKSETFTYAYGAIYQLGADEYWYVNYFELGNEHFDANGEFSYRRGSVTMTRIEDTEAVRAMIASTDYSYPNYIYENSGSNTVETDDTGSWIFLWVAYAVFILLPPIPVIAVGAILPHIKKIGKPKYWFILMAFAILWLVAAILLGVLMAVMTSMLI